MFKKEKQHIITQIFFYLLDGHELLRSIFLCVKTSPGSDGNPPMGLRSWGRDFSNCFHKAFEDT